jgi:hypothetical protein
MNTSKREDLIINEETMDNYEYAYNIPFLVTMHFAFKFLTDGILEVCEFQRFFDEMYQKYKCNNVRRLYQSKLDLFLYEHK